jgi:hypothetical protein
MSIKRRLNAVAKQLTPTIESMNQAIEMRLITTRLEELVNYCERKQARSEERRKNGGKSAGQVAYEAQQAERKRIADIHNEEAKERLADQQQENAQPDVVKKKKK